MIMVLLGALSGQDGFTNLMLMPSFASGDFRASIAISSYLALLYHLIGLSLRALYSISIFLALRRYVLARSIFTLLNGWFLFSCLRVDVASSNSCFIAASAAAMRRAALPGDSSSAASIAVL